MTDKHWNSGNDVAIFRVGDAPEHGSSLPDFNIKSVKGPSNTFDLNPK